MRRRSKSVGALAAQHDPDGEHDKFEVAEKRPLFHIIYVHPHLILETRVAPTTHLPDARAPLLDGEASEVFRFPFNGLGRQGWSRSDETHMTEEDIEQLR